jgi:hypothetical protein
MEFDPIEDGLFSLHGLKRDSCCDSHSKLYGILGDALHKSEDSGRIIAELYNPELASVQNLESRRVLVNRLFGQYCKNLCREHFAAWKIFTKQRLVRRRLGDLLLKHVAVSPKRVFREWKHLSSLNAIRRAENAHHSLLLHSAKKLREDLQKAKLVCKESKKYLKQLTRERDKQERVVQAIEEKATEQEKRAENQYRECRDFVDSKHKRIQAELAQLEELEKIERQYEMTHELYDQYKSEKMDELDDLHEEKATIALPAQSRTSRQQ